MKRPQSQLMKNDRGQSLVEFALTLPMLLVVMFMVTEFGRALFQYNVLAQATREGARSACVSAESSAPGIGEARMDSFLVAANFPTTGLTLACVVEPDFAGSGSSIVRATADLPFRWVLQGDLPTSIDGRTTVSPDGGLVLHAETVMKAETF